ncbi:MAG: cytochrome c [Steroidobacteraceae bacterium]
MTEPARAASSPPLLARGEYLARAANCVACHTVAGGAPFAGGLKMAVPGLGAIYGTNITPDKQHGIGLYTYEDFERAVRRGVARDGHRLYPAMPYPSYAKIASNDVRALYAFFMEGVPAAAVPNKPSEIRAPLNWRWPLKLWNGLFAPDVGFTSDPDQSAQWNRGAYLVEGLGHCGACHTPRGLLFQEKGLDASDGDFLRGAELDNWFASNLRGNARSGLGQWSEPEIAEFLATGHNRHSTAFGTMIEVINNSTQFLTASDLTAMAVYLRSLPSDDADERYRYDSASTQALRSGSLQSNGARVYLQTCAACHGMDGKGFAPWLPPLAGNPVILDKDPVSLVNVTLNGSARIVVRGMPDAYRMPQFRVALGDQDIADVLTFIRSAWGHDADEVDAKDVQGLRQSTDPASTEIHVLRMK